MNQAIREQFEQTSLEQLQLAVNAADGRPEVTDIWVYTSYVGGFLMCETVFGINGTTPVEAFFLDSALAEPVGSTTEDWQAELGDGTSDAALALLEVYRAQEEEFPTRIVVHYDVAAESMDSTFSYNQLDADLLDPVPLFEKWLENARRTGDFSADATTVSA